MFAQVKPTWSLQKPDLGKDDYSVLLICFVCLVGCLGNTPGGAQGILQFLHSEIVPGKFRETYGMPEIEPN